MLKDLLINHLAPGEIDRTGERVDGKATIIGKLGYYWIAVLDAEYRINTVMYVPNGYVSTMHGITQTSYSNPTTGMSAAELLATVPVDFLTSEQTNYAYLSADISSLPNLPVRHCTGISINGTTASMPNIQTLCFVWTWREFVDEHDPTLSSYPTQGLTSWGSDSYYKAAGSSTQTYAGAAGTSYFMVDRSGNVLSNRYGSGASTQIIPILEIPAYEDRTGERVDNKATIIGKLGENWIAVLDAAYRSSPIAFRTDTNSNYTDGIPNIDGTYNVRASWTENNILAKEMFDIHSAKWNTDYMNQRNLDGNPAAKFCYNQTISGKTAQLPNIQELALMWTKRSYIDANDPTVSDNMSKRAEAWATSSEFVWSSSGSNSYNNASVISGYGSAGGRNITAQAMVFPILEIPLYKDRTGERVDGKATIAGKLGNYWIAVLDAAYRSTSLAWGTSTDIFNITTLGTNYSFPYSAGEAAFLNTAQLRNNNTSRDLTNVQTSTRPAALFCRDTILAGFQCSLPNIQTMSFVRSWKTWLDSQDPTVSENQGASLSNSNLHMWTSSPKSNSATEAYFVSTNIAMSTTRTSQHGVCPILEIPLWCDDDYK